MEERFKKVEDEFIELRKDYNQHKITEREFKDRLKQLRLTDKNGRCWTIGAKTGKWYYYDGEDWVEEKPPTLQQGKAICIYCGFENSIKSEACDYCGGNMTSRGFRCPICGCELISPSQDCPECEALAEAQEAVDKTEGSGGPPAPSEDFDQGETGGPPTPSQTEKDVIFGQYEDTGSLGEERAVFPDDGGPNAVLHSVNPSSLFLFSGIMGTILGILLGVFVGISEFFMGIVRSLPPGIQSMHGSLFGGVVYGLLGGIFGFAALGALGFLWGVLVNVVLSFFGGLKLRIGKLD
jgi:hypothetical protein